MALVEATALTPEAPCEMLQALEASAAAEEPQADTNTSAGEEARATTDLAIAKSLAPTQEAACETPQAPTVEVSTQGVACQAPLALEASAAVSEEPQPEIDTPAGEEACATTELAPGKSVAARKKGVKVPNLEIMAAKIKRLQDEAKEADASKEALVRTRQELEAKIVAAGADADAKRAAALKASKEYVRKQCEAAIAQLETRVPKKPYPAYLIFSMEVSIKGVPAHEQNQKRKEMWESMGEQEKKKFVDRSDAQKAKYSSWSQSEEGQAYIRERSELINRCKAEGFDELEVALNSGSSAGKATHTKRAKETQDTPLKHRRVAAADGVALDEQVRAEAEKAGMLALLQNLANRPEVHALSRSSGELWTALRASNGMVNAAKRAIVGA